MAFMYNFFGKELQI